MSSLSELRAAYAPLLLLDAASSKVQVGSLETDFRSDQWATSNLEAGIGIFECVARLPHEPDEYNALVFCDGPGSILGIRTAAMALRTWLMLKSRPAFCYNSLHLVGLALGQPGLPVIADARRGLWHRYILGGQMERIESADIGPTSVIPEGFRNWTPLPSTTSITSYRLPDLLAAITTLDLFSSTGEPEAFMHEEPKYKTWTPQIHRAP